MTQFINEAKRMQFLAGILIENTQPKKYYAVFNILGEFNNGTPFYVITDTKEQMVDTLNKAFKEITKTTWKGKYVEPYSIEDMEESARVLDNGTVLDGYISDDWASVTDNK